MKTSQLAMRYHVVPRTLCFVLDGDDVLLIKRSPRKQLFPGKINGLGGHVEQDEDVRTAVTREIMEEAGIGVADLWLAGVVNVDVSAQRGDAAATNGAPGVMLFVFTAQAASREVRASEEGELLWVPLTVCTEPAEAAVSNLDWVGGKPDLLWQALEARERGRPFFAHKKARG
ncbi:MAG: NUDIX domain-containing protein [Chloroflexi bacterium]|nr:NUDIX domain-containing protein [Chloroflexota bacterium]